MRETRVILCTLGTRGDILPFISIAQALLRQGYQTTIFSNENWKSLVEGEGIDFQSIAEADPSQCGRDDYKFFLKNTLPSFSKSFDLVFQAHCVHPKLLLIYRSNMLGMECAAEKIGLPHMKVALQPSAIRSYVRPPWPMTPLAQGAFKPVFRALVVPALYLAADLSRRYRSHTNAFRQSHGLKPHRFASRAQRSEDATIVLAPAWFAMPQADWPSNTHCVGFPFSEREERDDEIAKFIRDNGKPIVFTPGTGVQDTQAFFRKAEGACQALGLPGIFLSPTAPSLVLRGQTPILAKSFADFHWLMPKTRLLVHHGGIGTTAQALRAGIPQLVLPGRFDQPDNAVRVASMGLGAAIMNETQTGAWASIIEQLLGSPGMPQKLAKVATSIARENATGKSIKVIESVLRRRGAE